MGSGRLCLSSFNVLVNWTRTHKHVLEPTLQHLQVVSQALDKNNLKMVIQTQVLKRKECKVSIVIGTYQSNSGNAKDAPDLWFGSTLPGHLGESLPSTHGKNRPLVDALRATWSIFPLLRAAGGCGALVGGWRQRELHVERPTRLNK